jgi:hypothetical protein
VSGIELPQAAIRVLGAARCSTLHDEAGLWISEGEGEVRYLVRRMPDHFRLVRYDRGDDPVWQVSADDLDDVARFLMVELGPVARAYHGLVPVIFPTFDPTVAPDAERQIDAQGIVVRKQGKIRGVFPSEDQSGVSRSTDFTWYADVELEHIAGLILTTTVAPAPPT